MTPDNGPPDPFEVVARALGRPRESLTNESAMYRDHGWDSLGHLGVIMGIEEALGMSIGNDEAWTLKNMEAISKLFKNHNGSEQP